jgi:hypothetical protein
VRKLTGSRTDTEAINKALDILIANSRIEKTFSMVKGKGKIRDAYNRVSN